MEHHGEAHHEEPSGVGNDSIFPLRVIHLSETLSEQAGGGVCFYTPTGWTFHVISHTWSQGIRDLSQTIGNQLLARSRSSSYDLAFRHANLRGQACFEALLQFLDILAADGVEEIWIDALCINQTDLAEKSREIALMGEYYKNSKGCYVLTHGIDQGYQMWKKVGAVPRWFTRVWTLQEFVLPDKLFFTVSDLNRSTIAYINQCILKWGAPNVGFCNCILSHAVTCGLESVYGHYDPEPMCPSDCIFSPNRQCPECGTLAIREAGVTGLDDQPVYFIEREAYLQLAFVDSAVQIPFQAPLSFQGMGNFFAEQNMLLEKILTKELCRPNQLITEISNRHCSVEEDRVLSILGLLNVGTQQMGQLRAGRTLQEQIIALTMQLQCSDEGQDFLVEMMAMDYRGCNSMQGMSWVPNFCSNENRRIGSQPVRRCVEVGQVTEAGNLSLDCAKVARVRMSVGTISERDTYVTYGLNHSAFDGSARIDFEAWGCQGFSLDIQIHSSRSYSGKISVTGRNEHNIVERGKPFEFDAWLVLLATFLYNPDLGSRSTSSESVLGHPFPQPAQEADNVTLVCLNKADDGCADLHKIGLVNLGPAGSLVFGESRPCATPCLLGGAASAWEGLEDAYFHCSLQEKPNLKWVIDQHTFEIQELV